MGWRQETKVADLPDEAEIEVVCRVCGKHRYEWPRELTNQARLGRLYMDELQDVLRCFDRRCGGPVRVAVMHDHLNEGFVGGMP